LSVFTWSQLNSPLPPRAPPLGGPLYSDIAAGCLSLQLLSQAPVMGV